MTVVVFDIETTGLSPLYGHRIIEIGAVLLERGEIVDEFTSLIDVDPPIPRQAQRIHGISDRMLRGQPHQENVMQDFRRFIGEKTLVAHNVSFDSHFLRAEFGRLGFDLPNRLECTLRLSRRHLPRLPNHRLETVYRHLGGVMDDSIRRHRALDDARMAAFVWRVLQALPGQD